MPVQGTRVTADTIIDSVVYVHQEVIANIESEMECKTCIVPGACTFYTYFLATDTLYHPYCFLLTRGSHEGPLHGSWARPSPARPASHAASR